MPDPVLWQPSDPLSSPTSAGPVDLPQRHTFPAVSAQAEQECEVGFIPADTGLCQEVPLVQLLIGLAEPLLELVLQSRTSYPVLLPPSLLQVSDLLCGLKALPAFSSLSQFSLTTKYVLTSSFQQRPTNIASHSKCM